MTDYSPLATGDGFFTIFALDHRDALMVELQNEADTPEPNPEDLRRFKRDMLDAFGHLAERPSAVMLEPEFSLPDLRHAVPDGVGVTCALEAQGYFSDVEAGNSLMEGWHPGRVTEVGADAAKLLVLYRHDRGEFTAAQERLVAEVVDGAAGGRGSGADRTGAGRCHRRKRPAGCDPGRRGAARLHGGHAAQAAVSRQGSLQ